MRKVNARRTAKSQSCFSPLERKIILEDQDCSLRSFHVGYFRDCPDLSRCPCDHFSEITFDEVRCRQEIIRKLEGM
jgi:hypothetical protein